jgi:hypothetical protein
MLGCGSKQVNDAQSRCSSGGSQEENKWDFGRMTAHPETSGASA